MVSIKNPEEISAMREGGKILAKIIKELAKKVRPGISTLELNGAAEALISLSGGQCSFLGYEGYPACLCTSINEEIVHAAPSERVLKEGDIVSLDLGIFYKGFHTDMAITLSVGKVKPEIEKLIEVTKKSLEVGIKEIKPGKHLGDIGFVIQKYAESNGFNIVRDLCGHGIGREVHEEPQILNYGKRGTGLELKEGMVICVEPMIATGDWRIKKEGFCYKTVDNSFSAHFEHTIAVTKNGCKILTK